MDKVVHNNFKQKSHRRWIKFAPQQYQHFSATLLICGNYCHSIFRIKTSWFLETGRFWE